MFGYSLRKICLVIYTFLMGVSIFLVSLYSSESFRTWQKHMGPPTGFIQRRFNITAFGKSSHGKFEEGPWSRGRDMNKGPFNGKHFGQEECVPGYVQSAMSRFHPSFNPAEHLFMNTSYESWKYSGDSLHNLKLPFGLGKGNKKLLDSILNKLSEFSKPDRFGKGCKRCILVASGGVSLGHNLGKTIDTYDIVIRMNNAPIKGYEDYIGSKTSFRFQYPETAFSTPEDLEEDSDVVFVAYKVADLYWLDAVLKNEVPSIASSFTIGSNHKYWKSVPAGLAKSPQNVRFINPHVVLLAAYEYIGTNNIPSIGIVAMVTALHYCDQVDITGYGFSERLPYHYYDLSVLGQPVANHDWDSEKDFILQLLRYGIIGKDLTGMYTQEVKDKWQDIDN
ncbi:CMP-N-acetylneuraminate-beta-1,4-galactoside alpha-2,3-sialyltransferase-like isoform X2 [Ptychodera flava]|uniref:CMP-N-acetylneuraminate-beta-1,4-galactoside alpha-2,3-sialyltransferase-like isoform X2 n=1 Tax=Ptychodera flava TaxID=63121 RepID=UPI00396A1737